MKKRILVTGASGFAGKCLSNYLIKKKIKVTRIVFKNKSNIKDKKIDLTKVIKLKSNFDWIIHAAAHHKISDFKKSAKIKYKKNILMVKNLINFSKKKNINNFIYFSTIDANYSTYPIKKNIYIKSKVFCEKMLLLALKKRIFKKVIILRLPAIVGKKSNDNFIKKTLKNLKKNKPIKVWNKNSNFNNLIHIDDLNKLIFNFISKKNKKNKIFIDCLSSKSIQLSKIIFFLKKKLKSKSKINFLSSEEKFKKIQFHPISNYKFFTVKKALNLLI